MPDQIKSIEGLIPVLQKHPLAKDAGRLCWYRGQPDAGWDLTPSLHRKGVRSDAEGALIKRFKQNAYSLLKPAPQEDWDWLFIMQHHGAPTRLLDWSENPLVALFFAVGGGDSAHLKKDGALWLLDPVALNTHAHIQSTIGGELPFFGVDRELDEYLTAQLVLPKDKPPVAALAPRYFPRLSAQAGVFTISHKDRKPVNKVEGGKYSSVLSIPAASKSKILKELATLGITKLSLFPELDSVALHARAAVL